MSVLHGIHKNNSCELIILNPFNKMNNCIFMHQYICTFFVTQIAHRKQIRKQKLLKKNKGIKTSLKIFSLVYNEYLIKSSPVHKNYIYSYFEKHLSILFYVNNDQFYVYIF